MKTNLMAILATTTMLAGTAEASEVIFAHGSNPGNPRYEAAEKWAELFAECTGGEHSVNVAGSATMGDDVEMLTSASAGVIQVTASSQGAMSQIVRRQIISGRLSGFRIAGSGPSLSEFMRFQIGGASAA
jgi:TRAP-type C4-dicarboxylate transport system substrate-binding protein